MIRLILARLFSGRKGILDGMHGRPCRIAVA